MVRPHQLALCQLVSIYIGPSDGHVLPCEAIQELCAFLLREISGPAASKPTYPSLTVLLENLAAAVPGRASAHIAHLLVHSLQKLESPDDVLQKFLELRELLTTHTAHATDDDGHPTSLEPRSAIGLFLRRCLAQVLALPFEGLCRLWGDVREYVQDDIPVWGENDKGPSEGDMGLRDVPSLERLLNQRVVEADRLPGRSQPGTIASELKQMTAMASDVPKVHLMEHIASLQARDSASATSALHRYFDYSAGRQRPGQAAMGANRAALSGGPPASDAHLPASRAGMLSEMHAAAGLPAGNLGIGRFQSALLSLGAVHTSLGHTREAYQALEETVRIAQQSSDNQVLVHALAALCRLSMVSGGPSSGRGGSEQTASLQGDGSGSSALPGEPHAAAHRRVLLHLLHRCLVRAKELKLPHLVGYARLAIAKVQLEAGLGASPAAPRLLGPPPAAAGRPGLDASNAQRQLERLHHLTALAAPVPTVSVVAGAKDAAAAPPPALRGLAEIFPATQGLFAGQPEGNAGASAAAVSQLTGEAHLLSAAAWQLHGCPELSLSHALIHAGCYGESASSMDAAQGLATLASVLSSCRGAEAGMAALQLHPDLLPEGGLPPVEEAAALLGAQSEVAHGNAGAAALMGGRLCAMSAPNAGPLSPAWIEGEMACINASAAAGGFDQAAEAAQRLFLRCHTAGRQVECVRLLCSIGEFHLLAGSAATALPYLLSCAAHCAAAGMDGLGAQAAVGLAEAWCIIGGQHVPRALALLRSVHPLALGRGGAELGARTHLATARALLQEATPTDVATSPGLVLDMLASAASGFAQVGLLAKAGEAHHLAAMVADAAGLPERRDTEAEAWLRTTVVAPKSAGVSPTPRPEAESPVAAAIAAI